MAIRNIVKIGDDVLRKKCRDVINFDGRLHYLLDDMKDTMYQAEGVGLAAVQVGILKRVVVIDVGDGLIELINKINAGDSTVLPYMEFAQTYPVRDSMRMMRLLYRLSLGSQENKQEQLLVFSKSVSNFL